MSSSNKGIRRKPMANPNQHSPRLLLSGRGALPERCRMSRTYLRAVAALMLLVPLQATGQGAAGQQDDSDSIGRVWHNYTVQQSVEIGGRITRNTGNNQ